jgi:hypothetical protein
MLILIDLVDLQRAPIIVNIPHRQEVQRLYLSVLHEINYTFFATFLLAKVMTIFLYTCGKIKRVNIYCRYIGLN